MDTSSEKATVENIDKPSAYQGSVSPVTDVDNEFSPEEQKRIIKRIDRRLVTTLGALYCVSLMDRTNLGAAAIAGMNKELLLVGNRYVSIPRTRLSGKIGGQMKEKKDH